MTARGREELFAEVVEQGAALGDLVFDLVRAECEGKVLGVDIGLYALAHAMAAICTGAELCGTRPSAEATLRKYAALAAACSREMLEVARADAAGGPH